MQPVASMSFDYVLVGGGLAASLIALALFEARPAARVALVEQDSALGGNHLWCFHAGDVDASCGFVTPLVVHRWASYEVRFPALQRTLEEPYAAVTSERLHAVVTQAFARRRATGSQVFLGQRALSATATSVSLASGQTLTAGLVIESRGPEAFPSHVRTGYQKFVGLELELSRSSPLRAPILMDALVPQRDGFRFLYALPLADDRVLLEDTYFSDTPSLDHARLETEILSYAAEHGFRVSRVLRRESGVLPLPTRAPRLEPPGAAAPLIAGYQGGWFHPVTGYSFPVAARVARAVASTDPNTLRQQVWPALLREQRSQLGFGVLLNRMLFSAFAADERTGAIEHFYRLPAASVRRFYALSLTRTDRLRLVCGRPPRGFSLQRALGLGTSRGASLS
jgi:lycopene beta-cyclase